MRLRCSHGENKNRRFYMCEMHRIPYASTSSGLTRKTRQLTHSKFLTASIRTRLNVLYGESEEVGRRRFSRPLCSQLCKLIELYAHDQTTGSHHFQVK